MAVRAVRRDQAAICREGKVGMVITIPTAPVETVVAEEQVMAPQKEETGVKPAAPATAMAVPVAVAVLAETMVVKAVPAARAAKEVVTETAAAAVAAAAVAEKVATAARVETGGNQVMAPATAVAAEAAAAAVPVAAEAAAAAVVEKPRVVAMAGVPATVAKEVLQTHRVTVATVEAPTVAVAAVGRNPEAR